MKSVILAVTAAPRTGFLALLPEPDKLVQMAYRVGLTVAGAFIVQRLLFLLASRVEKVVHRTGGEDEASQQRARTLNLVIRNVVTTLVIAGALIRILAVLGWNIQPLLAGAGIFGVAVGFGAQSLVRDVIIGIFILTENMYSVGDLIEVDGKPATVENITLRVTTLRDFNGYVHFVPNGEMRTVTNRSRGWQRLAVDVPVATGDDFDSALDVCRGVAKEMNDDPVWRARLMDPIDVWGVEALTSSEATLRMVLRAHPGPDAPEVSRELRRRVHAALAHAGHRFSASREILLAPGAQPARS
jgi:small conductance mechanosensitive channel